MEREWNKHGTNLKLFYMRKENNRELKNESEDEWRKEAKEKIMKKSSQEITVF